MAHQLDLFAPKPRSADEALLMRRLRDVERGKPVPIFNSMTRAAVRRLMTPLPRITVPR